MQESRYHWWLVLVICGVACIARAGMLWQQGNRLNQDVDAYMEIAGHLASGDGFAKDQPPHLTAYRPPLLPLLMAAIFKLGGSPFVLGVVHVVLGTISTALTIRVGQLLLLGWASLVTGCIVAVDPLLLQYTVLPMTETLCATLVILWCWVMLEFPTQTEVGEPLGAWHSLLHGGCFGLICLCRPGFLAAVGLAGVWLIFQALRRASKHGLGATGCARAESTIEGDAGTGTASGTPNPLTLAAWLAVGMIIVLAPWTIRNALVIGKATPATTHGGYTLLLANNPVFYHEVVAQPWGTVWQGDSLNRWQRDLESQMIQEGIATSDEVSRDRWMYRKAFSHIQAEPGLFALACIWRGLRFWDLAPWRAGGYPQLLVWGTAIFYGIVACGIIVGLFRLTHLEWKTWGLLLLLPLTLWLTHLVYWTDMRMRAPVVPILALLAARGCVRTSLNVPLDEPNLRPKP